VIAPPVGLVLAVLGSIIAGIAAPTEAAAMGSLGALVVCALGPAADAGAGGRDAAHDGADHRDDDVHPDLRTGLRAGLPRLQGEQMVHDLFEFLPGRHRGRHLVHAGAVFVLGFFLEWIEISYIAVPIFLPIFAQAGVDPVWLATLICVMLQTSFLTPPFGWALFFLRSVAPPEITTGHIYRGVVPFVGMQFVAVAAVYFAPGLATWLPRAIGW
jgi:TRAP-type mannitol/chloroaromatic compound transport system permease large subunit